MSTPFNFDDITRAVTNLTTQSQEVSRTVHNAANGIAEEQVTAAEAAIDYGLRALRLPEAAEPAQLIAERVAEQRQFFETMGESATRILSIATDVGTQTFNVLSEAARRPA